MSWSINPVLAEQFPALYDYFASTASANDSFIIARRINAVAEANHFVSVYGGLKWKAKTVPSDREFWPLWTETIAKLDEDIIVVGAKEMTRLAKEAQYSNPTSKLVAR